MDSRFRGNDEGAHWTGYATLGLMQFTETVAVNRGLPVTVFPAVADAEKWLLERDRADTEPHAAAGPEKPHR